LCSFFSPHSIHPSWWRRPTEGGKQMEMKERGNRGGKERKMRVVGISDKRTTENTKPGGG
jgi:hypothetical protein